jgi:hypothetical protein
MGRFEIGSIKVHYYMVDNNRRSILPGVGYYIDWFLR